MSSKKEIHFVEDEDSDKQVIKLQKSPKKVDTKEDYLNKKIINLNTSLHTNDSKTDSLHQRNKPTEKPSFPINKDNTTHPKKKVA